LVKGLSDSLLMGKLPISYITGNSSLKVPKCEIFKRSAFRDFYTIKSQWGGGDEVDFVAKIIFYFLFRGSFRAAKFLTHMLIAQSNFKEDFL
jgi:hypothetical protein